MGKDQPRRRVDEGMCRSFAGPETMDFCHVFGSSDCNLFELLKWTHAHDHHDLPGTNDGRRMSWSHESRIPVGEPSARRAEGWQGW